MVPRLRVCSAGDTKRFPHNDAAKGNGCLAEGGERCRAHADCPTLLRLFSDQEAWAVHEMNERQMKRGRQIAPTDEFLATVCGPGAAINHGIFSKEGDGNAIKASETRHDGFTPLPADFKEGP